MTEPFDQVMRIGPAREFEQVHSLRTNKTALVNVRGWVDHTQDEIVADIAAGKAGVVLAKATVPFVEGGGLGDVMFRPKQTILIRQLDIVTADGVFIHPLYDLGRLGQVVKAGQVCRLALGHVKLLQKGDV